MNPLTSTRRLLTCVALAAALLETAAAAPTRALPAGQVPNDVRLQPPRDLDGYFPFHPPATAAAWEARSAQVRRRILVSLGLWPMPTRMPLNAVIHGRIDRDGYTVEKVYFESAPGFFVTGNLYRPKNVAGKAPGVLFAHGHWRDARLAEADDDELRREIATGEERFVEGGRSRFQSMCVQLARMGCVVWQWDMLGDSDSGQLSRELVHDFAKQRPEMATPESWGLFSPQAESHLQSAMGLQAWNAIRSLDFLLSLPEVDPERVAATGASGGGTQTFILGAIDPRVRLAFPAVMVSTAMQGGCTCENACLLRIDTGNVEFAALFAPKPLGLTTADDWTREMASKGFPELKQLYALLGAPDQVMLHRGEHFPHNYNAVSRSAFYGWLNRHFHIGLKEPIIERDYAPLSRAQLTVWDDQHPAPKAADPDLERELLRLWHDDARQQLADVAGSADGFRKLVAPALETILGRTLADAGHVVWLTTAEEKHAGWTRRTGILRNASHREELPVVVLRPTTTDGRAVLWLSAAGKAGLFAADGMPRAEIQRLLAAGRVVVGVDLFQQGEFLAEGRPVERTRRVANPREAAAYTFGYNHTLFAQRVHDVLTALAWLKATEGGAARVSLVGLAGAGHWAAAARAQAGEALEAAVIDTAGFRFGAVTDIHSPDFLPGGAKYFDLPGMIAAAAPGPLLLADREEDWSRLVELSRAAGLTRLEGEPERRPARAVEWLLTRQ